MAYCSLLYHKAIGFFTLHSSFFHFHLWCHQKSTISVSQFFPSQTQSIASANAKHCNRPRKALQLPTQSFATANAKLCNRQCKALQSLPQKDLLEQASSFRNPLPNIFPLSRYFTHGDRRICKQKGCASLRTQICLSVLADISL